MFEGLSITYNSLVSCARALSLEVLARAIATVPAVALIASGSLLSGCSTIYVIENAIGQASLLSKRAPISEVIANEQTDPGLKRKLELVQKAKAFAETELGLKPSKNYTQFVQLDRPYVTTVVSAAPTDRLEHHLWWFPIVGSVPYKGFFNPAKAERERNDLEREGLDVFVRGVTAYSTLGWFNDPVLSSMTDRSDDYELVELILHELFHTTVFVPGGTDFNERLATFFARKGADRFFQSATIWVDGPKLSLIQTARDEEMDVNRMRTFMAKEIEDLKKWYAEQSRSSEQGSAEKTRKGIEDQTHQNQFLESRREKFQGIQDRFVQTVMPNLKSKERALAFKSQLDPLKLNNARLMAWTLYESDHSSLESKWNELNQDPKRFVEWAAQLKAPY